MLVSPACISVFQKKEIAKLLAILAEAFHQVKRIQMEPFVDIFYDTFRFPDVSSPEVPQLFNDWKIFWSKNVVSGRRNRMP